MRLELLDRKKRVVITLLMSSLVSVALYFIGAVFNNDGPLWYLIWNLFLAWIPLVLAWLLIRFLETNLWSSWRGLFLTLVWLIFLPNTFYMISDFLHLFDIPGSNVMFNIALIGLFAFNSLLLGYLSLWLIHQQLIKRGHSLRLVWSLVSLTLLVSSYAIYLGRYIRLNSWDIFTSLNSVVFAITDQVLHPSIYPSVIGVTMSFFILLMTSYLVIIRLSSDILKE